MVLTSSTMLRLGTDAPDFALTDVVSGATISLDHFRDRPALLVIFLCNHCPYVKHIKGELARLGRDYGPRGVGIVGISSNDVRTHPDDAPARLRSLGQEVTFPICYDETQEVAKAYTAACTPDFFLFNRARQLVYRGQLDDSRPGSDRPVTGSDLRAALDAVLAGQPVSADQRPSIGCNIKWKAGNEPPYFQP